MGTSNVEFREPLLAAVSHLDYLRALEQKALWLAVWTIHNANFVRPKRDGLKVGGHPASCSSLTTLMTALYFDVLRPDDRVAVKPMPAPSSTRSSISSGGKSEGRWRISALWVVPSRTPQELRTMTTLISQPVPKASGQHLRPSRVDPGIPALQEPSGRDGFAGTDGGPGGRRRTRRRQCP